MSKKKKNGKRSVNKKHYGAGPGTAGKTIAFLFASYMFTVFPLYFHNNYIDIQMAKYRAFVYAAAVFVPASAAAMLWEYLDKKRGAGIQSCCFRARGDKGKLQRGMAKTAENAGKSEKLMLFFSALMLCSMTISTVRVPWKEDALSGAVSRRMGLVTWFFCLTAFLLLKKTGGIRRSIRYVFAGGSGTVMFVGIMNFLGLDPLRMYKNLVKNQHTYFQSTIGNVNFLAGFLCLAVSVNLALFYCAENKWDRIVFGIMSVAGIYAGFASVSDTFLIGCSGAFLVFLFISLRDPCGTKKFWNLCILFYFSALLMKLTISNVKGSDPGFISNFPQKGIIYFVMKPAFLIVSFLVIGLLIFFERFFLSKKPQLYPKIRKILFSTAGAAALCLIILVIIANSIKAGWKKSSLLHWFYIKEPFGSSRGFIWKRAAWTFVKMPFIQKLFGCGPDCLYYAIKPYYGEEMLSKFGSRFTDAHNDFLEMLLTTGIAGTTGYFGILITGLVNGIRNHRSSISSLAESALIGTCLFLGIVSNCQIAVTPFFFVLLGLLENDR